MRGAFQWDMTDQVTWDVSITYIKHDLASLLNNEVDNERTGATGLTKDGVPFAGIAAGDKKNFGSGNETESIHFTLDISWRTGLGEVNILTSYLKLDQDNALSGHPGFHHYTSWMRLIDLDDGLAKVLTPHQSAKKPGRCFEPFYQVFFVAYLSLL